MIEFELDGKKVNANSGATILEVALNEGKYIPHFCYHKKLSIAANCRMCLVEVEKAPKPMPACATPITEGMKVHTCSKLAVEAQKGVMEFLLINHPLDCPICDQGGECQLQDLAVGYGKSATRFKEEKRAVSNKDLGSLVSTAMTRCIHCSRCVRFTDEIAGFQELGMSYRNNHVEVMPFIGKTIDSEISGNIIDICPVGALTSKPFKDKSRSWELSRRKSIAPHDGLGSNLVVQVDKYHKVVRVLPLENELVNECWLSDRDRFSYEGLYHEERAMKPMIKQDGKWIDVSWDVALDYAAKSINGVKIDHGAEAIGVLASAVSTTEELYLLQKLMREIDVHNLDYRLWQSDFTLDNNYNGAQYLSSSIAELAAAQSILLIGSVIREEQPLLAAKIRQATKHGCKLNVINVLDEDLLCTVANKQVVDPRELSYSLAQLVKVTGGSGSHIDLQHVEISEASQQMAHSLVKDNCLIILGDVAKSLPNSSEIMLLAQQLATNINAKVSVLSTKANEVGADLVGFVPYKSAFNAKNSTQGLNAKQMLENPRHAYVLLNTELEYDAYNSAQALNALKQAQSVLVLSAYVTETMLDYADVILPIAPFSETSGSYVNMLGMWQKFNGTTRSFGDSRPAWKVLRVIANKLGLAKFDYESIEDVRNELVTLNDAKCMLNNTVESKNIIITKPKLEGSVRVGVYNIYGGDSIVRRAKSLQETKIAKASQITCGMSGRFDPIEII